MEGVIMIIKRLTCPQGLKDDYFAAEGERWRKVGDES